MEISEKELEEIAIASCKNDKFMLERIGWSRFVVDPEFNRYSLVYEYNDEELLAVSLLNTEEGVFVGLYPNYFVDFNYLAAIRKMEELGLIDK